MKTHQSKKLFLRAQKFFPSGVNSPILSFRTVGGIPRYISSAYDAIIKDVDKNEYLDYCLCFGAKILGHSHQQITKVIKTMAEKGVNYGGNNSYEVELAEMISKAIPSMEMMRMIDSQTEAVMSAIRLARGYTKRDKIIKFEGCYHGHSESILVKAPVLDVISLGIPETPGVPVNSARNTIVLPYNDIEKVRKTIRENYRIIGAVIVEPIATSMGVVIPEKEFLEEIYTLTRKFGILLIFDETTTAFRIRYGGVQNFFNIKPDLTCIGRTISGGLPLGVFGGKKEIMECLAPFGNIHSSETFFGSPLIMHVGTEILKILQDPKVYISLEENTKYICQIAKQQAEDLQIKVCINQIGSMFTLFFTEHKVKNFQTAKLSDARKYAIFFHSLLNQNIYFPPSQLEAVFLSTAHTKKDIEKTVNSIYKALKEIKKKTA